MTPTGSHLSLEKGVTPFKVSKHPQSTQRSGGPGLKGEASAVLAGTNKIKRSVEAMGSWLKTLRSHMLSSQKTKKKAKHSFLPSGFTMRCCYGCHQGTMSENPRSFLPSHLLPPFYFHFLIPLRCFKWNHA